MSMLRKRLIIIFGVVAFSLVVGGIYYFFKGLPEQNLPGTQVPETKVYYNEEWGFEFQYPRDWLLEETFMNGVVTKFNLAGTPSQQERLIYTIFPPFELQIVPLERATRLTELFYAQSNPATSMKVGSVVGEKYNYDLDYGKRPRTAIILPIAEYKLILEIDSQFEDTLKQITDTFKFLEADLPPVPKPIPDKIFRNPEFGFEFSYPGTWLLYENTFSSGASKYNLSASAPENEDWAFNTPLLINIVNPEFVELSFKNIEKTTSELVVDGISGVKYQYEFEGGEKTTIILPLREHKMILGTTKAYENIFNQILATFKFLK